MFMGRICKILNTVGLKVRVVVEHPVVVYYMLRVYCYIPRFSTKEMIWFNYDSEILLKVAKQYLVGNNCTPNTIL